MLNSFLAYSIFLNFSLRAGKPEKIHAADVNVAELLVRKVLNRCELRKMRSDNVGIVVYYPQPSEEKIKKLMEQADARPDMTSLYPWMEDPDQGIHTNSY